VAYIIDFKSGSEQLYTTPATERMGYLGDHCVKIADSVANVYYSFYKNVMEGSSKDESFSEKLKDEYIF
jgi:hypothetical protein